MGCDGGSFCYRSEMVRLRSRKSPKDGHNPEELRRALWTCCALSRDPLADPIVATPAGRLLNKESALEALIKCKRDFHHPQTATTPQALQETLKRDLGIASLRDLIPVNLKASMDASAVFECPITGKPGNGRVPFLLGPECGCLFARAALSEVADREEGKCCPVCQATCPRFLQINGEEGKAREQLSWWKTRQRRSKRQQ